MVVGIIADGGIEWSIENLKVMMQLRHRNEFHGPIGQDMESLREFVREQIAQAEVAIPGHGGDRKGQDNNVILTPLQGNNPVYALRRLKRDRPDIAQKVITGELSPHAAAVETLDKLYASRYCSLMKQLDKTKEPSAFAYKPERTPAQPLSAEAARRIKEAMVAPANEATPAALEAIARYRSMTRS